MTSENNIRPTPDAIRPDRIRVYCEYAKAKSECALRRDSLIRQLDEKYRCRFQNPIDTDNNNFDGSEYSVEFDRIHKEYETVVESLDSKWEKEGLSNLLPFEWLLEDDGFYSDYYYEFLHLEYSPDITGQDLLIAFKTAGVAGAKRRGRLYGWYAHEDIQLRLYKRKRFRAALGWRYYLPFNQKAYAMFRLQSRKAIELAMANDLPVLTEYLDERDREKVAHMSEASGCLLFTFWCILGFLELGLVQSPSPSGMVRLGSIALGCIPVAVVSFALAFISRPKWVKDTARGLLLFTAYSSGMFAYARSEWWLGLDSKNGPDELNWVWWSEGFTIGALIVYAVLMTKYMFHLWRVDQDRARADRANNERVRAHRDREETRQLLQMAALMCDQHTAACERALAELEQAKQEVVECQRAIAECDREIAACDQPISESDRQRMVRKRGAAESKLAVAAERGIVLADYYASLLEDE